NDNNKRRPMIPHRPPFLLPSFSHLHSLDATAERLALSKPDRMRLTIGVIFAFVSCLRQALRSIVAALQITQSYALDLYSFHDTKHTTLLDHHRRRRSNDLWQYPSACRRTWWHRFDGAWSQELQGLWLPTRNGRISGFAW